MIRRIQKRYREFERSGRKRALLTGALLMLYIPLLLFCNYLELSPVPVPLIAGVLLVVAGWLAGAGTAAAGGVAILLVTGGMGYFSEIAVYENLSTGIQSVVLALAAGVLAGFAGDLHHKNRVQFKRLQKETARRRNSDILIREINHRTKNNLALIAGFLDLQIFRCADETLEEILKSCKSRVLSVAEIHKELYRNNRDGTVNIKAYIERLISMIEQTFTLDKKIVFDTKIDEVLIDAADAVAYSLIINELLTNSLKHAFAGRTSGRVEIVFRVKSGSVYLRIEDNGRGLPAAFHENGNADNPAIGMLLVRGLVDQLGANLETGKGEGACFIITG